MKGPAGTGGVRASSPGRCWGSEGENLTPLGVILGPDHSSEWVPRDLDAGRATAGKGSSTPLCDTFQSPLVFISWGWPALAGPARTLPREMHEPSRAKMETGVCVVPVRSTGCGQGCKN